MLRSGQTGDGWASLDRPIVPTTAIFGEVCRIPKRIGWHTPDEAVGLLCERPGFIDRPSQFLVSLLKLRRRILL
jgi:hypothetical protein